MAVNVFKSQQRKQLTASHFIKDTAKEFLLSEILWWIRKYCCCCSITKSCLTHSNPMDWSMTDLPVLQYILEFAQIHVHWVYDANLTISSPIVPFSSCLPSFPASRSFPMSQLFASGGQSIRASASALPMNSQGWFPLGLNCLISLLSRGLSRVFFLFLLGINYIGQDTVPP